MSIRRSVPLASALAIASILPVAAQTRVPDAGMAAIGGSIGGALPAGEQPDNGLHLAATVEGFLTPRVAVRGDVGAGWIGADRRGFRMDLRPPFFNVNLFYNWERGVWHPYITGGLGLYRYSSAIPTGTMDPKLRDDLIALGFDLTPGTIEGSDRELGANLGGGVEYFLSSRSTVVGEFRYHGVGNVAGIIPFEGSFFSLSAGLKRYF
jgi:Outer membrane protein beta-barrel domain